MVETKGLIIIAVVHQPNNKSRSRQQKLESLLSLPAGHCWQLACVKLARWGGVWWKGRGLGLHVGSMSCEVQNLSALVRVHETGFPDTGCGG